MSKKIEIDVDFLKAVTVLLYTGSYSPLVFAEHRETFQTLATLVNEHAKDTEPSDKG